MYFMSNKINKKAPFGALNDTLSNLEVEVSVYAKCGQQNRIITSAEKIPT